MLKHKIKEINKKLSAEHFKSLTNDEKDLYLRYHEFEEYQRYKKYKKNIIKKNDTIISILLCLSGLIIILLFIRKYSLKKLKSFIF